MLCQSHIHAGTATLRLGFSARRRVETNALDPVTGLPSFNAASDALDQDTGRHNAYLVAVMADRVSAISSRWGFVVGDHVLCSVSARLRKALTANDRVYRRRGPALMAIVLRDNGIEGVRREIARIWNKTEDETISVGKVSVTVSISASWSVFALQPREGLERKLEMFLTGKAAKDLKLTDSFQGIQPSDLIRFAWKFIKTPILTHLGFTYETSVFKWYCILIRSKEIIWRIF